VAAGERGEYCRKELVAYTMASSLAINGQAKYELLQRGKVPRHVAHGR
jgi:hypothetical protein